MSHKTRVFRKIRSEFKATILGSLMKIPGSDSSSILTLLPYSGISDAAISPAKPDIDKGISPVKNEIEDEKHGI